MLALAYLVACSCNDDPLDSIDTDSFSYTAVDTDTKPVMSSGDTGDTDDGVNICADAEACWRFEEEFTMGSVEDLSTNNNTLLLEGGATIASPGRVLPEGIPNLGFLSLGGEPARAFRQVDNTNIVSFADGITFEALVSAAESGGDPPFIAADGNGDRIRTIAWLSDGTFALWLEEAENGDRSLVARLNYSGDSAGACGVEARAAIENRGPADPLCVSVTYANEELLVYVDGTQVANAVATAECGSAVGPAPSEARWVIGADGTSGVDEDSDHSWRGAIDEVRIMSGVPDDVLDDLRCAAGIMP